jgi:hypothetical protein
MIMSPERRLALRSSTRSSTGPTNPTLTQRPSDPGLIWINAPHFCAGAEVIGSVVSGGIAPIIRYMLGWDIERVRSYCQRKRWMLCIL